MRHSPVAGGRGAEVKFLALMMVFVLVACTESGDDGPKLSMKELMDPTACMDCHPNHYREWSGSMHAYASDDPVFLAMNARGQRETNGELGDFCVKCHAPVALHLKATTDGLNLEELPQYMKGVTCYFCHSVESVEGKHNNPLVLAEDGVMRGGIKDPVATLAHDAVYSELLDRTQPASADMCGSCHDIVTPAGVHLERTYSEWLDTVFAGDEVEQQNTCSQCHMRGSEGLAAEAEGVFLRTVHDHSFPGVDVALTPWPEMEAQREAIERELKTVLVSQICVVEEGPNGPEAQVMLQNVAAGHSFPSGAGQDRRAWVELVAYKGDEVVHSSGVIKDDEVVVDSPDLDLWLMRDRVYDENNDETHMFWEADRVVSALLQGMTTNHDISPEGELVHIPVETRVVQSYYLPEIPDRIAMKVRIRPMGLEILDDLIESGDLDPAIRDQMPTFDLGGSVLEWNPDDAREQLTLLGLEATCVPPYLPQGSTDPLSGADFFSAGLEKMGKKNRKLMMRKRILLRPEQLAPHFLRSGRIRHFRNEFRPRVRENPAFGSDTPGQNVEKKERSRHEPPVQISGGGVSPNVRRESSFRFRDLQSGGLDLLRS